MIVTIRDAETGEVIRQVPGEDALRIAQRIEDTAERDARREGVGRR